MLLLETGGDRAEAENWLRKAEREEPKAAYELGELKRESDEPE
jgi:hypothetical protein